MASLAGPPFVTDDPETVDYQHWKFYVASQHEKTAEGWDGSAAFFEINYGVISNVQLHLIAPLAYEAPTHGKTQIDHGDTEVGVKYRFVQEASHCPQVGVFPLLEVPTGEEDRSLGSSHLGAVLTPLATKELGPGTTSVDSEWRRCSTAPPRKSTTQTIRLSIYP